MFEYTDNTRKMRYARILMFALLAVGGLVGLFLPSYVIEHVANSYTAMGWAVTFTLSSMTCLVSVVIRQPRIELIGLPLLIAGIIFHGICSFASYQFTDVNLYMTACIDAAMAVGFFNRLQGIKMTVGSIRKK